ncbi:MAG: 50S ribosomal protein L4 [Flavobacteriales bacterium]|jgi:large subunit ribosomal protein L4|nr:50S ribosomal protein L4 [Flavobacteriales bacterium]MBU47037.1 50S ribosomal protein L4 [Flavobacteriales bacterium]|tara:strand:+ start:4201 stop:4824 length:624 start_codon:yes stop_codon:yes gene_type:complete
MKLAVHNITGKETSKKIDLSKEIFGFEPNDHAIYLDVKQYLAAQRTGTHKTKGRSEVKGSRRKLRKQKGSGAARVGDIKNPLFRGGGRVFGPQPRSYNFKVNKKVKRLARKSALSHKAKDKNIIVLEDFTFEKPNTKSYSNFLSNFDLLDNKTVLVLSESNKNILLSSRNLKKSRVVLASELNTYDVMNANKLMIMESSINEIEKNF